MCNHQKSKINPHVVVWTHFIFVMTRILVFGHEKRRKTTNLLLLMYHVMNHTRGGKCHLHVTLNQHGHVHKGHLLREG